jgi:hypothetical protein
MSYGFKYNKRLEGDFVGRPFLIRNKGGYVMNNNTIVIDIFDNNNNKVDYAIIDSFDIDKVNPYKWQKDEDDIYFYAINEKGDKIYLANEIMELEDGYKQVAYISKDTRDNRRSNLILVVDDEESYDAGYKEGYKEGYKKAADDIAKKAGTVEDIIEELAKDYYKQGFNKGINLSDEEKKFYKQYNELEKDIASLLDKCYSLLDDLENKKN